MPVVFWPGCQACSWVEKSRKNCIKGNWWKGPASSVGSLPSKQDQGATQTPWFPGKHHISSASSARRKCQVPATGVLVASCHFLFHPLCLAVQPMRKAPSNNPPFPGLRQTDTQSFSFLPHIQPRSASEPSVRRSAHSACSLPSARVPKIAPPHLSLEGGELLKAASMMAGTLF